MRIVKNKNLNIRLSNETLKMIEEKAKASGTNKTELVEIATELVKVDDVVQYLLDKIKNKHEQKIIT